MAVSEKPKKKIPERRCTGCGESKPKIELMRVVRAPDGTISLDTTGKKAGRGAYLCRSVTCLRRARRAHRLETNLDCAIPDGIYEALEEELNGSLEGK